MNRELKFRAWDKNCKTMREVRAIEWDNYGGLDVDYACYNMNNFAGGPDTLMQFTGLKDKNGKEIYEEDIVKCDEEMASGYGNNAVGVIKWDEINARYWVRCKGLGAQLLNGGKELEVIGNIYENPDLLK